MASQDSTSKLMQYWYRLLAKKQYSKYELIEKAKRSSFSERVISAGIAMLESQNLLHDELIAECIIATKSHKNGKKSLVMKMRKRGIDPNIIEHSLQNYTENLSPIIVAQLNAKYANLTPQEKRYKITTYLASRGYLQPQDLYARYFINE